MVADAGNGYLDARREELRRGIRLGLLFSIQTPPGFTLTYLDNPLASFF